MLDEVQLLVSSPAAQIDRSVVLDVVLDVGRAVAGGSDMPQLLELIVTKACEVAQAERAALAFVADETELVTLRAWRGMPDRQALAYQGRVGRGLLGRSVALQQPLTQADVPESEVEAFFSGHTLVLPLVAERRPKGVLALCRQEPWDDFEALEAMSAHFAAAIDNVWLYDRYRSLNAELEQKIDERTQELRLAQQQLLQQEKMASLGQLTAGVAHEINNPLAFVSSNLDLIEAKTQRLWREAARTILPSEPIGQKTLIEELRTHSRFALEATQFLAEWPPEPSEQEEALKAFWAYVQRCDAGEEGSARETLSSMTRFILKTREGVARIKGIVADLRSFSRLDETRFDLSDLHEGLESALSLLGHHFKGTNVLVHRHYALEERVPCHPARLNQVFLNILVNAAQALGSQGDIHLRTYRRGVAAIVEVQDSGPGINPTDLARIFDPFFTTKPVGVGTGLGLSLSYGIVKDHEGTIEVESAPGKGSTFRVVLPLSFAALPNSPEERSCQEP